MGTQCTTDHTVPPILKSGQSLSTVLTFVQVLCTDKLFFQDLYSKNERNISIDAVTKEENSF